MKLVEPRPQEPQEMLSLCTMTVDGRHFGIETHRVREVLGRRAVQRVPLAPAYLGGIVSYRGEVLTTVSLRAVLGLPPATRESFVLVLAEGASGGAEADGETERFGLMVDTVGSVLRVERDSLAANPSTLNERSRALFDGALRRPEGLLVRLEVCKLRPESLMMLYDEWQDGGAHGAMAAIQTVRQERQAAR